MTTGGPEAVYQKGGWDGDIHAILRPIQRGVLRFTGWPVLAPNRVYAPVRASAEERQTWRKNWTGRLHEIESEQPIDFVGKESFPTTIAAPEKLCRTYWYRLYAFVRRRG